MELNVVESAEGKLRLIAQFVASDLVCDRQPRCALAAPPSRPRVYLCLFHRLRHSWHWPCEDSEVRQLHVTSARFSAGEFIICLLPFFPSFSAQ